MGTGSFLRVQRPGCGLDHPPPSKAEVTRRNKTVSFLHLWTVVAYYKARFTFTFNTVLSHMDSTHALISYFLEVSFIVPLCLSLSITSTRFTWPPHICSTNYTRLSIPHYCFFSHKLPLTFMQQNLIVFVLITS